MPCSNGVHGVVCPMPLVGSTIIADVLVGSFSLQVFHVHKVDGAIYNYFVLLTSETGLLSWTGNIGHSNVHYSMPPNLECVRQSGP